MADFEENEWRLIFMIGAGAAFLSVVLIPVQIALYIVWPLPTGVEGWYVVFSENWLRGLIGLDVLLVVQNLLVGLLYLALAVVLWRGSRALVTLAGGLGFLGLASYFPSNTGFEMLNLSRQFSEAVDPDTAVQILAAGRAALATFVGTAFDVYYVLSGFALLLFSLAMLKNAHFTRMTAVTGVVAGIFMLLPPTAGPAGMVMAFLSLVPWAVFAVLAGRTLWRKT